MSCQARALASAGLYSGPRRATLGPAGVVGGAAGIAMGTVGAAVGAVGAAIDAVGVGVADVGLAGACGADGMVGMTWVAASAGFTARASGRRNAGTAGAPVGIALAAADGD